MKGGFPVIQIFSPDQSKDFYKYIDMPTKREVRGARDYVVRTHNGALLVSFHTVDEHGAVLFANDERCSMMTGTPRLIEKAEGIDHESGFEELFAFFLALTSSDIYELARLEDKIEALEDELFSEEAVPDKDGINAIMELRREISQKKRYYEEMELLSDELADMEPEFVFIDKKFDRLYDFILRNPEYLEQVREAYQAQIDLVQNNTMKTLTVVTMIFLPLQLITGWFGMNLIMPEFDWANGYPYVICLSVIVLIGEICFFKWRKWF